MPVIPLDAIGRCRACGEVIALPKGARTWVHAPPVKDPHEAIFTSKGQEVRRPAKGRFEPRYEVDRDDWGNQIVVRTDPEPDAKRLHLPPIQQAGDET